MDEQTPVDRAMDRATRRKVQALTFALQVATLTKVPGPTMNDGREFILDTAKAIYDWLNPG